MSEPKVMVVANRKGGTAKTTTVVNLAYTLAMQNQRVLVIDTDNQGHIAHGFLADAPATRTVTPAWLNNDNYFKGVVHYHPQLDLCLPRSTIDYLEHNVGLDWLCRFIGHAEVQQGYDIVLIDTPPTLGPILLSALAAADTIIIPAEPSPLSSDGVGKLITACTSAIRKKQFRANKILILPVMVDQQLKLHRHVLKQWSARFGGQRLLPYIRRNIKLAEAFSHRTPVTEYAPRSHGAEDYSVLCAHLFNHQ